MKNKVLWIVIAILLSALIYSNTERVQTASAEPKSENREMVFLKSLPLPECGKEYALMVNAAGVYCKDGNFWCSNERACLHEVGHFVDERLGYPSKSEGEPVTFARGVILSNELSWQQAIDEYYLENLTALQVCEVLLFECIVWKWPGIWDKDRISGWGGYTELYAELYAYWRLGWMEMPHEFLKFYE